MGYIRIILPMRYGILILFIHVYVLALGQKPATIRVRKPAAETCKASLLGSTGGNISWNTLIDVAALQVKGPCDYRISSFIFYGVVNEKIVFEIKGTNDSLSAEAHWALISLRPGSRFYIEKIRVKSQVTGQVFSLPDLKFKVTD